MHGLLLITTAECKVQEFARMQPRVPRAMHRSDPAGVEAVPSLRAGSSTMRGETDVD